MRRALAAMAILAAAAALAARGDEETGARAYREGRFAEAFAAFAEAERRAGDDATPVLLHNLALAALRAGNPEEADAAAEKMAERGGPEFAAVRDFVRGNAALARAERAARLASEPEAEPFAFDAAIALAETARAAWERAAVSRPDWPEARRNAERASLEIASLRAKKAEAETKRKKSEKDPAPPPPPEPEKKEEDDAAPDEAAASPTLALLSKEEVERLFERLGQKEREKLALRRAERRARATAGERDW